MGSEYPSRQNKRQSSAAPLRIFPGIVKSHYRKSLSTSAGVAASNKIPKTALTPISRLKKFQKLRDRNLREQVLDRNNLRKQLKMLETVEAHPSDASPVKAPAQILKELPKLENGENENGEKENGQRENGANGLNGIEEEELEVVEQNGVKENEEVRRSPRRSRQKEPEVSVEQAEEEVKIVEHHEIKSSPGRHTPEVRDLEVDVKVVETPASSSKRRSILRRSTPDVTSTFTERTVESSNVDLSWRNDTVRISGRRPIRDFSPSRKRKSDEFEEPSSKRMAYTPSVPSPGWRFLSPFSLFKRTPQVINRPVDDSLFVNVSTDSETEVDLDTTNTSETNELSPDENHESSNDIIERPTVESPTKSSTSWLCKIM